SLRYSWNYARLLAQGPSQEALVESPVLRAMQDGKIVRVEELTRLPADVQDTLISILSEKTLAIPELDIEIRAKPGFNLIATANDRDRGVNDLSSALKRRFNTVELPLPATLDAEVEIVANRVESMSKNLHLPAQKAPEEEIKRLLTIFRELRSGKTMDGKTKLKSPASTLSTAEAIAVILNGQVLAQHFGSGGLKADDLAAGLMGAIVKDPMRDKQAWLEYLETVIRGRKQWKDLYQACKELL
ncbi:MAG: AAA family ATPase, partial [Bacteroidota bacterium]